MRSVPLCSSHVQTENRQSVLLKFTEITEMVQKIDKNFQREAFENRLKTQSAIKYRDRRVYKTVEFIVEAKNFTSLLI